MTDCREKAISELQKRKDKKYTVIKTETKNMKRYTAEVTVYSDVLMTRITSITQSVFSITV